MARRGVPTALALIPLACASLARPDGGVFIPAPLAGGEAKVSSSAQQALLVWEDGTETLHVRSNYRGPATEFAWVIPVPSRPTVRESSWELFTRIEQYTRPRVEVYTRESLRHPPVFPCGCAAGLQSSPGGAARESGVTPLETLDIQEFRVNIVHATDAGGFVHWLRGRGYAVSGRAEPVLERYIRKGFYFVAAKLRASATSATTAASSIAGGLTPLAVTFRSSRPFYPLTISAVSAAPENELLLLTLTPAQLEPAEYPATPLTDNDVATALGPTLRPGAFGSVDFGPAIRAAQKRLGAPCLVIESELDRSGSFLASDGLTMAAKLVRVTRFHAFLAPDDLRDITFLDALHPRPERDGSLRVVIDGLPPSASARGGLALAGLALACLAGRRRRWARPMRDVAVFVLLVSMAVAV